MKLSPLQLHTIKRMVPYAVIWIIATLLYGIVEKGLLGDFPYYPSTGNAYRFSSSLFFLVLMGFVFGPIFGLLEVSLFKNLFSHRPFIIRILLKTSAYIIMLYTALLLITFISNSTTLGLPIFHQDVIQSVKNFIFNFVFTSIFIYAGVFIGVALFVSEVIASLGMDIVSKFFTGKYQNPVNETRIFMFLDMKSSTSLAEKLGNIPYS